MESIFLHSLSLWGPLVYVVLFFAAAIEGDLSIFTAGFLAHEGIINVPEGFFVAFAGALLSDISWYGLGIYSLGLPLWLKNFINKIGEPFDKYITTRLGTLIFGTKFFYGIHKSIIARIGMRGVRFSTFLRIDAIAIVLWFLIIGSLGYIAGSSFGLVKEYLKFTEMGLLVGFMALLIGERVFSMFIRKEMGE